MTLRAVFLPLLLLSTAIAQDAAPVELAGKDHAPICRGKDSDAPDCISAPRAIYAPDPKYPKKERKAHHQGTVVLWLAVDADGLPRDIKVLRRLSPEFDAAAIDIVKKWRFSPATKNGKPVATLVNLELSFHLY
jgi:TonB family protein